MAIEIVRATPEHTADIARIAFDAFDAVSKRHGFASDVASRDMAQAMACGFVNRPDVYGVVAVDGGAVVGHNFVQLSDAVAGVGPICVDPHRQAKGVGRQLMQHVVDYALANHGPQVRLYQDAFNTTSLSLYTSIGYDVTEPVAMMSVPPATDGTAGDAACRPLTPGDADAADALCLATQKVSRRNELLGMIEHGPGMGCVPHGRFAGGTLTAVVIPGFFGFAAAQSADDLLACARVANAALPPPLQRILLPTRNGLLLRAAFAQGFRTLKVGQLMAIGPYEQPTGFWAPSISY